MVKAARVLWAFVLCFAMSGFVWGQGSVPDAVVPGDAGVTALTGDIKIIGAGDEENKDGPAHRFAAAFPCATSDDRVVVCYPNPDLVDPGTTVPFVDIYAADGTRLLAHQAGYLDDDGQGIAVQSELASGSVTGPAIECSRDGNDYFCVWSRVSPWKYLGGNLAAWGSGTLDFGDSESGVGVGQVFDKDGAAISGVLNLWTDDITTDNDLIADGGEIRSRAVSPLSNGDWCATFWDRKTPALGSTGDRWATDFPAYAGSGQIVGLLIFKNDGTVVARKPISTPGEGSADSMRGSAAGDGWCAVRYEDSVQAGGDNSGGSRTVYHIFDNTGAELAKINVAEALFDSGLIAGLDAAGAAGLAGGRGDGEQISGRGAYLYASHWNATEMYVSKWDAVNGELDDVVLAYDSAHVRGQARPVTDSAGNIAMTFADDSLATAGSFDETPTEAVTIFLWNDLSPATPPVVPFENSNTATGRFGDDGGEPPNENAGRKWKDNNTALNDRIVAVTSHTTGLPGYDFTDLDREMEHALRIFESPFYTPVKPGDMNLDGSVDIADPVADLNFQFAGISLDECLLEGISLNASGLLIADFNGDGSHDISDPVGSLNWQFVGGGNPPHVLGTDCIPLNGSGCDGLCTE